MLKHITRALPMSFLLLSLPSFQAVSADLDEQFVQEQLRVVQGSFASLEHQRLGDSVKLNWFPLSSPHSNPNHITLQNGLILTYGEILYLAGDLTGDEHHSISHCPQDKPSTCFQQQFEALAVQNGPQCQSPTQYLPRIINYMQNLDVELKKAEEQGISFAQFHTQHANDINQQMNRLSCGGSRLSAFWPFGRYLKLAAKNFDHFSPDAKTAYSVGHSLALQSALNAHDAYLAGDMGLAQQQLMLAYAQNAFASHFLTDGFSSGHMRTPRYAIHERFRIPDILKLLLANLMHDEDSLEGLWVSMPDGTQFKAYGDNQLFEPAAAIQKKFVLSALKKSTNQIYTTFRTGIKPSLQERYQAFPKPLAQQQNHAPLFRIKQGVLEKRRCNFDIQCFDWTSEINPIQTLLDFWWHKKNNS